MLLGLISDTHGLLRPEALAALAGCDRIFHTGDVGDFSILDRLAGIAPVTAIRGNVDRSGRCGQLPATEAIELAGHLFYLIHDIGQLDLKPEAAGISAVIYGHSHQPKIEWRGAADRPVLFMNPGSAGPQRFSLPITLGFIDIASYGLVPRIHPLLLTE